MAPKGGSTSRKGKKQWRKNIDDTELINALAKETKEQLRGIDLKGVKDQDLFVVDNDLAAVAQAPTSLSLRQQRKAEARTKLTRSQAILAEAQAGKTIPRGVRKKDKVPLPAPRQVQVVQGLKGKAAGGRVAAKRGRAAEAEAVDLWSSGDEEGKKAYRPKPNRPKIKAVEVDMPGCSYNPTEEDHEDAVAAAVAHEMTRELRKELQPQAPSQFLIGPPPDELDGLVLYEPEPGPEEEAGGSDAEEDEGPGAKMPKKKTKSQRNKEKRVRELEKALAAKKDLKKQRQDLQNLKQLKAELQLVESQRDLVRQRRAKLQEEKEETAPPRLGKHRFEGEDIRVMASDELTGSLRQIKQEGLLLKDRFRSLEKRGVLEVRKAETKRRKRNKRIVYTQGERGEKALERQVEITEMMRQNNQLAKEKAAELEEAGQE